MRDPISESEIAELVNRIITNFLVGNNFDFFIKAKFLIEDI